MIRACVVMLVALTLITGLVYPLVMTAIAALLWPGEAGGSLLRDGGAIAGSRLLGQAFDDPRYLWGRPSATAPHPYNAASSSGSNLGPLSAELREATEARRRALAAADPGNGAAIPIDLLTSSASGLDPHISPEAAEYQAARVARRRGMDAAAVRAVIAAHTVGRHWGFLGEPVVNVLAVNRALDGK